MAAYLLSSDGRAKNEASIRENLPPYAEIHTASLAQHGDTDHAEDTLRKQLRRDVEALAGAGITVHIEGAREGRLYILPPSGFSPVEVDLSDEERAVLVGALRALRRDFPYAGPLRLALANLIGAASAGTLQGGYEDEEGSVTYAAVATRDDEAVAARVATLERSVSRCKRVRFDYYAISRDETLNAWCELFGQELSGRCPRIRVGLPIPIPEGKGTDSWSMWTPSSPYSTSWSTTSASPVRKRNSTPDQMHP